ncbi:hypothetical protein FAM18149_01372 [Lacticaseibacillus paracasei]|nr:hypothetical protein FAM18149_01372 [Lacticaseibacillus paracasei]TEA86755.1 hypothetical protein TK35_12290 [Lacticaseibacillus paracasei]TEA88268.1 hypothetical protein TK36_12325 [Lacticaseibacillus paracasei]
MSIVAHKKRLSDVSRFLCALINLAMCKNLIGIGNGTIPCQVDTYKNENTIFLIRPNRGNIPPRFGHFF